MCVDVEVLEREDCVVGIGVKGLQSGVRGETVKIKGHFRDNTET